MKYIIESYFENEIKKYKVIAATEKPSLNFEGNQEISEGDDNLTYPMVELRPSTILPEGLFYPYVVEDVVRLEGFNQLQVETETLKTEILSEDYETGNILPKLKKIARFQQLQLKLASGDF